ncbi:MAG: DUF3106 domain-containing protein [Bryobacteraceae bacterium]
MPRLCSIACLACLLAAGGWAGENAPKPPEAAPAPRPHAAAPGGRPNLARGAAAGHKLNNPLNPGQRFLQMTPEEQERLMERANPQQQERMRAALERYRNLPPAARERLFQQYQLLKALPLRQQALISHQFQAFNQLPDERRVPVGQELLRLHRMPPEERSARLDSDEFAARYSPTERQILSGLSLNLPPEYPLGGKPGK